jgi:hypothetical protein
MERGSRCQLQDGHGRVLAPRRPPEGVAGLAQLHDLIADHLDEHAEQDSGWSGSKPIVVAGSGQRVAAIESSQLSWKLARDRVSASRASVEQSGLVRPSRRADSLGVTVAS